MPLCPQAEEENIQRLSQSVRRFALGEFFCGAIQVSEEGKGGTEEFRIFSTVDSKATSLAKHPLPQLRPSES